MKIDFVVVADTHEFGVDPTGTQLPAPGENTILLGDIVDRKNALPKNTIAATERMNQLMALHKDNYITGNHEKFFGNTLKVVNGILFCHGDEPFYGDQWRTRRLGDIGCGKFLGSFKWVGSKWRTIFPYTLSAKDTEILTKYAKALNCHTVVVGHKHPKELQIGGGGGVKCIVVPRGITNLSLYC